MQKNLHFINRKHCIAPQKRNLKKIIGTLILRIGGWTEDYPQNFEVDKCVMISAPHTSFKDYLYSIASFWKRDVEVNILFKNSRVTSLSNYFIKKISGVNFSDITADGVDYSVNLMNNSLKLILIVPTECHLKKVDKWKTEFYDIAKKAKVPVALGYLDYSDKVTGIGHLFKVSGNKERDMRKIENFYKNFTPKYPEKYNTKIC